MGTGSDAAILVSIFAGQKRGLHEEVQLDHAGSGVACYSAFTEDRNA